MSIDFYLLVEADLVCILWVLVGGYHVAYSRSLLYLFFQINRRRFILLSPCFCPMIKTCMAIDSSQVAQSFFRHRLLRLVKINF